jgi:glycosyltransferase involved in cell wall biosynthesis
MKIAIDGYELNSTFTGVGRYLHNLLKSMLKYDLKNQYTLYLREVPVFDLNFKNLRIIVLNFNKSHTRWQNTVLIKALRHDKYDLFFSPDHSLPLLYRGKSVLTIHDPSWKTQKADYSLKERTVRDFKTGISLRKASLVFTVSNFSKAEILKYYNYPAQKIIPIHSGIEETFKSPSKELIERFKIKYNLKGFQTIGFLGSMFKRRHLKDLIKAFDLMDKTRIKLFLIGKDFSNLNLTANRDSSLIWLERIDEKDINAFYSSLDLFLYLSDYEGFGFPPLEALLNKTPSLLLEGSSLSEVFDKIAHFTTGTVPAHLKDRILSLLDNKKNLNSKIFQSFSNDRRAYFSWDRAAKEYLKYIHQL